MICPSCHSPDPSQTSPLSGMPKCPAWRCQVCNIRFVVTNPSELKGGWRWVRGTFVWDEAKKKNQ